MLLAVLNGTVGNLCAMGVTLSGAAGIARALGEDLAVSYGALMALAVGCGVLRGFLRYFEQYSNHYIAFRLLAVLRDRIFGALRLLCPAKLESKQKGSIIAMITSDIETLEVFYAHTISPICIAMLVSASVAMFVGIAANWWLSLAAVTGYITVGILAPMLSSAQLKASGMRYRAEFADFNAFFLDSIKGIKDIVLHNGGEKRRMEVDRRSDVLLNETKKMKRSITKASSSTELIVTAFILLVLAIGVVLTVRGELTIGRMVVGVTAVFGSFGPVIAISALPGNLTQTLASGDRVLDVLNDICMYAKKGEIVGIVGASGCGKSTFLKLLLRFWQKDSGRIEYNGADIDSVNTHSLLEHVTMVSQTTCLLDETIEYNLRIARPGASRGEIEAACKLASVHDFILSLPEGYQTRVGTLGDNLSAGEKQRIGLARAFLRGSELILLDEPTSNVDSINEGMILRALKEQKHKRSIVIVSHRESTMAIADRIYRVEGGRMYECG